MKGKVAIVTGAAGGFGRVLVRALLERGASVAALDVTDVGLAALRDSLRDHDERLSCMVTDIADYDACERATGEAARRFGGLHVLINNAAMGMNVIREDSMENLVGIRELTPQMWNRFVAVNLTGAWNMTRVCIEPMLDQRWGRIIDVTTSFFTMLRGSFQPYGPTKAGMEAMAAAHAAEEAEADSSRRDDRAHRLAVLERGRADHRQPLRGGGVEPRCSAAGGGAAAARTDRLAAAGAVAGVAGG